MRQRMKEMASAIQRLRKQVRGPAPTGHRRSLFQ
jgi:hypothetical protein